MVEFPLTMARIFPFQPYRYTEKAGPQGNLVTQPYDKISPDMQARYLSLSPYNLVRIILGERKTSDSQGDNLYTRAAGYLDQWIHQGILAQEAEPCLYAYFQEFRVPDTGETLTRKGFIGLGAVEGYSSGVVHRHEQTLSGPKKDRLELLRHTHAHFGQLFMLYPDPEAEVDRLLDETALSPPERCVVDEYGAQHRIWRIASAEVIGKMRELMADKRLLIADGHHRYETALAFRDESPDLPGAGKVMMTFVNMHSPGLKILATHRLVSGLPDFQVSQFLERASTSFRVTEIGSVDDLQKAWVDASSRSVIGAAISDRLYRLESISTEDELDVRVLHERILGSVLGINQEAVREEKNLRYVRGLDVAVKEARNGAAQIAFLLKPAPIDQVASISFAGGVMPQKSTDFYPKLLSGLAIYKVG